MKYNRNMTTQYNIHEAKTHLSNLIQRALNGEDIVIAKDGSPVVKLTPIQSGSLKRPEPGLYFGKIVLSPNFDDPLEEFEE
jgi:prevent-host-death family protein